MEVEQSFSCPHCAAEVSVLLDASAGGQSYVEDCEVCCRPMRLSYDVENGEIAGFSADAE